MVDAATQNLIKQYVQETVSALEPKVMARVDQACQGYDRGYDRGADDPGTAPGMQAHVTAEQSNLNPITALVQPASTLSASLFFWGDLINQAIGITASVPLAFATTVTTITSVATVPAGLLVTPTNFNPSNVEYSPSTGTTVLAGTGTIGFLPPYWLGAGTGIGTLNYFQSYQLTVAFLSQNISFFDVVNVVSSELGNQAPVLRSSSMSQTIASPYGLTQSNPVPLINAATPQDQQQNQIICALGFVASLFHYIVLSAANNSTNLVTLTMTFNAAMKEARGTAYGEKIRSQKNKGKMPSIQAGRQGNKLLGM